MISGYKYRKKYVKVISTLPSQYDNISVVKCQIYTVRMNNMHIAVDFKALSINISF